MSMSLREAVERATWLRQSILINCGKDDVDAEALRVLIEAVEKQQDAVAPQ